MSTSRLEAFSDGVLAIIITIMVLELKVPHGADPGGARAAAAGVPQLRAELHLRRHLLEQPPPHAAPRPTRSTGTILWANLHLLFWLSLVPFATGWMGENHFATWPTIVYGLDLLLSALAYFILERRIVAAQGQGGVLARAIGGDLKGKASPLLYVAGIAAVWFVGPWLGMAFFVAVALIWLVPDRRIERVLEEPD